MSGEIFKVADWNVSVTSQPMSEVAALATFLDWYSNHQAFDYTFLNGQIRIIPSRDQKKEERVSQ